MIGYWPASVECFECGFIQMVERDPERRDRGFLTELHSPDCSQHAHHGQKSGFIPPRLLHDPVKDCWKPWT